MGMVNRGRTTHIPAEAAFPSARAENRCASASVDLVSKMINDFTPPFCTILSSNSSARKTK